MTTNSGPPGPGEPGGPPVSCPAATTGYLPLPGSARIQLLDSLRGFALLGILVVNMMGFKYPFLAYSLTEPRFGGIANSLAQDLIWFFAAGKFISIFSLLFGLGLVMQQRRLEAAGHAFTPFIFRRMAALLVIGILHGILLWAGDILALYAIFGFLSPALLKLSARSIFRLTASLALLLAAFRLLEVNSFLAGLHGSGDRADAAEQWIKAYLHADFSGLVQIRFHEWTAIWRMGFEGTEAYSFLFFLVGIALGKADVLSKLDAWKARPARLARLALPLALAFNLLAVAYRSGWITPTPELHYVGAVDQLAGSALLTLVYLAAFVRSFQSGRFPRIHAALAAAGRLSLSNYLFQSVIANVLFMSWGFGLYGKVPAHLGLLLSLLIFMLQIHLSRIWLHRYPQGPAEWLWKKSR